MAVKAFIPTVLLLALAGCGGEREARSVPNVRGDRLDVAETRLDDLGLEYEELGGGAFGIVTASRWEVCDQTPRPGEQGTRVRLVVDRIGTCPPPPQRLFTIPHLVGARLADAEETLKARRVPHALESWDGNPIVRARARVCEQEPVAGRRAPAVTLYVARECEPIVPSLVGEDLEDAEQILREAGIRVKVVGFRGPREEKAFWAICEQEPDAGGTADAVTLYTRRTC
jgi:beta-lactam-binding protein with PASTA domain